MIKVAIVISLSVVVVVIVIIDVVLLPSADARLLARGRHGGWRVVPRSGTAADRRAGVADAVRAKPLAFRDGGEGWVEARVVVGVVALRTLVVCV